MKNKSAKIPACQLFFSQTWNFLNVYLVKQAGRSQATAESYRDSLTIFKNYYNSILISLHYYPENQGKRAPKARTRKPRNQITTNA